MFQLLKRLMPREPLPPHVHFHVDHNGDKVLCDESICRPRQRPAPLLPPWD